MTRQQQALAYFVRMGWTPAQAAGIVANLIAESNLNPAAVGDGGLAYGIAQWHPDRQANFRAIIGRDIHDSDFERQLAFVNAELNGFEKPAGDALRACTSAAEAGACVSTLYERPADRDGEAAKRGRLAEQLLAAAQIGAGATISPPDIPTPSPQPKGAQMPALALLQLFGPILAGLIPQIATLLKPDSEVAKRNVGIAETVLNTIVATSGSPNLQGAIEAMQTDKAVQARVQQAIVTAPDVMESLALVDVGGGPQAVREHELAIIDNRPWWVFLASASFWVALSMVPAVYLVIYRVLWGGASEQLQTVVVTAVLSGLLGSLTGFYFGSAYSNTRTTRPATTTTTASGTTTTS